MVNRRAPRCVDASTGVISPVGWSQSISLGQEDPIAAIAAEGSLNRDYDHKEADLIIDGLMARLYQAPVPLPVRCFIFLNYIFKYDVQEVFVLSYCIRLIFMS